MADAKEYDHLSLSEMNGREGRPAYVAYGGRVYDVSSSRLWKAGLHMRVHQAGRDLSASFGNAPHGEEVFEKFPVAGTFQVAGKPVVAPEAERQIPSFLAQSLDRFPRLRRHPHPMVVHFPIALYCSSVLFDFLYRALKDRSFEAAGFYCLAGAVLFMPAAMLTGFFTWWLNYLARPMRPVTRKIILSCILLAVSIVVLSWRIEAPGVTGGINTQSLVYLFFVFSQVPLVSAIGWYGALLTFPVEKSGRRSGG